MVFASNVTMNTSIASIVSILNTSPFQGVDLDIEDYDHSPFIVADYFKSLKAALKGYYLSLTVENVGIYQG